MTTTILQNCALPGKTDLFEIVITDQIITEVTPQNSSVVGRQPIAACGKVIFDKAVAAEQAADRDNLTDPAEDTTTIIDAQGNYLIGGLWDEHVHVDLQAQENTRIDLRDTSEPEEVLAKISSFINGLKEGTVKPQVADPQVPILIQASGFRPSGWSREATVMELDAVTGDIPVLMISGDAHSGWLNSACQKLLGTGPHLGLVREQEWFDLMAQVPQLPDYQARLRQGMARFVASACEKGLVGIRDMTFGEAQWEEFPTAWCEKLFVEVASYPDQFERAVADGNYTGMRLPTLDKPGLDITQGPLKIISDGSLGTETAYCCQPYSTGGHGIQNYSPAQLKKYLQIAADSGWEIAVHGIGDQALEDIIVVCEELAKSGLQLQGSLEHVQLLAEGQADRIAALGLAASVQPAHLLDDYPLAQKIWPDRMQRCYLFRDLEDAGVTVRLGSDAPVAPIDPWLAMAAAVYRGPVTATDTLSGNPADTETGVEWEWNPAQRMTVASALFASTRGHQTTPGTPANLVLVDRDPYLGTDGQVHGRKYAENLLATKVLLTMRTGKITYRAW